MSTVNGKTKAGRFLRLTLTNWRNFANVDVELADRVFVVGANATGKSNFLDAFRFLHDLARDGGGLTNALKGENRGGLKGIRSLYARKMPAVTIGCECEISDEKWRYELQLSLSGERICVNNERVERDGKSVYKQDTADEHTEFAATALEQPALNREFRVLRSFFQSTEYIHVVPQLVRKAPEEQRYGKGLGAQLIRSIADTPERVRNKRLKRIESALSKVVPQFKELQIFRDAGGLPHLRAKFMHWRPNGGWQDEASFSDGTLRLIGLFWYLLDDGGPLLLEEPEISLHTEIVRALPGLIAELSNLKNARRQVLVSTHAFELLNDSGIDPSEIILLKRGDKGATVATNGSKVPQLKAAAEQGMAFAEWLIQDTKPPESVKLTPMLREEPRV